MGDSNSWRERLADTGRLSAEIVEDILAIHGSRGAKAIEAIPEDRVKEYQDFTIVVGMNEEYIVEGNSCTCKDMEYNLDADDPQQLCWHVLAVEIAQRIGAVDRYDLYYTDVDPLI